MDNQIYDIRTSKDFSKTTFSGFKKTEVLSTLLKTITSNNIESSCYWCAECICSGYYIEVWELIILFVCKYIHIGYSVDVVKDTMMSCYWVDWIIEFDYNLRKAKNKLCVCNPRKYIDNEEDQKNIIWLLWDIFFEISKKNTVNNTLINSLLSLFILKFTKSTPKKRRFILYNCISILTENVNYNIPIINDKDIVVNIHNNIHKIYKQVQSNEIKDPNLIVNQEKPI